jgi:hypothetical protein
MYLPVKSGSKVKQQEKKRKFTSRNVFQLFAESIKGILRSLLFLINLTASLADCVRRSPQRRSPPSLKLRRAEAEREGFEPILIINLL